MKTNTKIYSDLTEIRDTLLLIDAVKLYKVNQKHFEALSNCLDNFEELKITDYKIAGIIYYEAARLASKIREYFIEHLYFDISDDNKAIEIQNNFAKDIIPQMNSFVEFIYNEICLKVA